MNTSLRQPALRLIQSTREPESLPSVVGVSSLVARRVFDRQGNFVGRLEEILIDTRSGCVRHAVIGCGGVLGVGRKRFAICWSAIEADAKDQSRCTVDSSLMRIAATPLPRSGWWGRAGLP